MREIKAFSKYLKNYKFNIGLNVVFNILYVIFSVFSLTIVMPFLDIIFHPDFPHLKGKIGFASTCSHNSFLIPYFIPH